MHQLVLPFAVMAVTILVAVGLMAFFRGLLKQRNELMADFVAAAQQSAKPAEPAHAARHDLAA